MLERFRNYLAALIKIVMATSRTTTKDEGVVSIKYNCELIVCNAATVLSLCEAELDYISTISEFISLVRLNRLCGGDTSSATCIPLIDFYSKDCLYGINHNIDLFNAGSGTNFIYEIQLPSGTNIYCDEFNRKTYGMTKRIKSRLDMLKNEYSAKFIFKGVQSRCFSQNLRTIDGDLPFLMSELLLIRYWSDNSDLKTCTNILTAENPLDFDVENHGAVYEYKVKRFLQDCALGMVPETPWTGVYDATGGQIIVKENGDVVCYHIYEQNRFLEYLINNTKFEGASTSEDKDNPGHPRINPAKKFFYGWLYEEEGKLYFKINLQVRFK